MGSWKARQPRRAPFTLDAADRTALRQLAGFARGRIVPRPAPGERASPLDPEHFARVAGGRVNVSFTVELGADDQVYRHAALSRADHGILPTVLRTEILGLLGFWETTIQAPSPVSDVVHAIELELEKPPRVVDREPSIEEMGWTPASGRKPKSREEASQYVMNVLLLMGELGQRLQGTPGFVYADIDDRGQGADLGIRVHFREAPPEGVVPARHRGVRVLLRVDPTATAPRTP